MTNTRSHLASNAVSILLILLACYLSAPLVASQELPLKENAVTLSAVVEHEDETNVVLRLKLTNIGTNTLTIPFGYLPWDRYAMSIAIIQADTYSTPIRQQTVIADPPPAKPHQMVAGETYEGEIDLVGRFPRLLEKLNQGDLILFWSYQCPCEGGLTERVYGSMVISKKSADKPRIIPRNP